LAARTFTEGDAHKELRTSAFALAIVLTKGSKNVAGRANRTAAVAVANRLRLSAAASTLDELFATPGRAGGIADQHSKTCRLLRPIWSATDGSRQRTPKKILAPYVSLPPAQRGGTVIRPVAKRWPCPRMHLKLDFGAFELGLNWVSRVA
jgi:hypothetical protein